jgi:LacI family gluconate utilization system Gnt-I transcriptional repressor
LIIDDPLNVVVVQMIALSFNRKSSLDWTAGTVLRGRMDTSTDRPRIEDVARLAGISPITVSRALRAPAMVSVHTRERIEAAIEQLGYIPNHSASSLASRRSGLVAVLVPTIGNSIFAETVRGVSDAIASLGLQILLGDYGYSIERERALLRMLAGRQPEAMVIVGVVEAETERRLLKSLGIPIIETWDLTEQPIDTVVGFPNAEAGAKVARHFLATGRRHLAFAGGTDARSTARRNGFCEAANAAPYCLTTKEPGETATGRTLLATIMQDAPDTDAVFLSSDVLAVGALLEARDRDIAVPDRLAIVGLGDLEIGRAMRPRLSTISVAAYEIGHRAGSILISRITDGVHGPQIIDVGCTMVVRESG